MVNNPDILTPERLKTMSLDQLDELADFCRCRIVESTSRNGGHLSSNLGAVELTIALVRVFEPFTDDILFDVGHQAYTDKLLTGRDLSTIRRQGGLSPFQDPRESPYDKYEAGHSSTAISTALGMAAAKKLASDRSATIAVVGDAALSNGLAFEGLNAVGEIQPGHFIIVLNDNGMSIGPTKGGLAQKPALDGKFFEAMGLDYIGPVDGHDIKTLLTVFAKVKASEVPIVVHLRTQKGHGYSPAQADSEGYWHGVTPFDPISLQPIDMHRGLVSFSHAKSDLLYERMRQNEKLILINPAMVKGAGEERIFADFPTRTFDVGIAEEHAFTFAAGLALKGFRPVITVYSTFFQRAFDECFHDLAHQRLQATVLLERSGLIGADGETHQGLYDVALALSMPGAKIYEPYDYSSLSYVLDRALTDTGLSFVRLPRELLTVGADLAVTTDYCVTDVGRETAVLAFGSEGRKLLLKDLPVTRIMLLARNGFDEKFYRTLLNCRQVVIYDPTATANGFGAYLAAELARRGFRGRLLTYAIPLAFVSHATRDEQLRSLGLDAESVYAELKSRL